MAEVDDTPEPVAQWWAEFKEAASPEVRDKLIVHFTPLVKYVVGRLRSALPPHVDQADLLSDGVIGLMDAVDKFDPDRGWQFSTYAVPRIRGAVMDGLRGSDWVPRSVRDKARRLDQGYQTLERSLGRPPSDEELATQLEVSVADLRALYRDAAYRQVVSVEALELHELAAPEVRGSGQEPDGMPADFLEAVRQLRVREQVVVALYYWERFTLAEIGQVLGVSESRVSQLNSGATKSMRQLLHVR